MSINPDDQYNKDTDLESYNPERDEQIENELREVADPIDESNPASMPDPEEETDDDSLPTLTITPDNIEKFGPFHRYRKVALTRATPAKGPFICITLEGPIEVDSEFDGFVAVDAQGFPYPIAAEVMRSTYEKVSAREGVQAVDNAKVDAEARRQYAETERIAEEERAKKGAQTPPPGAVTDAALAVAEPPSEPKPPPTPGRPRTAR